jgi:hypothetical protein
MLVLVLVLVLIRILILLLVLCFVQVDFFFRSGALCAFPSFIVSFSSS